MLVQESVNYSGLINIFVALQDTSATIECAI